MTKLKKHTNNIPKIPAYIIYTGKFLEFISPALATKYASFLFRKPFKFKTPEREKMMEKSAQNETVYIPALQKNIVVYSYGFSKRKVLLIHGWAGRGTQLYKIADKLLENGFMTISFDAPAHGKSEGDTTMMNEFIECALYLEEKYGPFEIAIGHSLGGMTVLNSIKKGLKVEKSVIIGAGDIITDIIIEFVKKVKFSKKMVQLLKNHYFKKFNEDIDNYSASVAAKSVSVPTLVIHDTDDKDVPVSSAHNIRKYLEKGEILITNGLGHRRILKDNNVIERIIEFIK